MALELNPGGVDKTAIQVLEKKKFAECPDGSGEVVVKTKICDMPPIEVEAAIEPFLPAGFVALNEYGEATSVPSATPANIISYTVPVGKVVALDKIEVSGENVAKYQVDIDGSIVGTRLTYWCDFNADFTFRQKRLVAGTVVKVTVEHNRPMTGDFFASIIGVEGDA